jgi:L-asparaginase II
MSEENIKYVDLVSSTRGNIVENIHQGIAVAMDSEGRVIKKWGDITTEIFPRSALKLIQTFGIITTGADKGLKLSDERIAFATSSHHAEPVHLIWLNLGFLN